MGNIYNKKVNMAKNSTQLEVLLLKLKTDSQKLNLNLDDTLLEEIAKDLGAAAYASDSKFVDSNSESELKTIKDKFLIGKLGLPDTSKLDDAIQEVLEQLKDLKNKKHRVLIYALLKKKFEKVKVEVKEEIKEEKNDVKSFFSSLISKIKQYF